MKAQLGEDYYVVHRTIIHRRPVYHHHNYVYVGGGGAAFLIICLLICCCLGGGSGKSSGNAGDPYMDNDGPRDEVIEVDEVEEVVDNGDPRYQGEVDVVEYR